MSLTQKSLVYRVSSQATGLTGFQALDTNDSETAVTDAQGNDLTSVIFPEDRPATIGASFVSADQSLIVLVGPVVNAAYGEGTEDFYTFTVLYDAASFASSWTTCYNTANENWIGHTDTDYTISIF